MAKCSNCRKEITGATYLLPNANRTSYDEFCSQECSRAKITALAAAQEGLIINPKRAIAVPSE